MGIFHPIRDARRKRLSKKPLKAEWAKLVNHHVPYWQLLAPDEKLKLDGMLQIFLAEKRFEGCRGMIITDRIRLTVAACACLLLLNLRHDFYARLSTVLVYPAGFSYENEAHYRDGISLVETRDVAGLSTSRGMIALSWVDAASGANHPSDGVNVILHECAHQLNFRNRSLLLTGRATLRDWAETLSKEYEQHRQAVNREEPTFINAYAATNREEFFAVVTEHFFEAPLGLQQAHPALYHAFRLYYGQDPATRFAWLQTGVQVGPAYPIH